MTIEKDTEDAEWSDLDLWLSLSTDDAMFVEVHLTRHDTPTSKAGKTETLISFKKQEETKQ